MAMTYSNWITWYVGSNGNTFSDYNGFRYCIAKCSDGYLITRDGIEIGVAPNMADAKLFVKRDR